MLYVMIKKKVGFHILALLIPFFLLGCTTLNPKGTVTKTDTGIVFDSNTECKLYYKDADVEASMDTTSPFLLKTLIEGAVVQGMKRETK